MRIVKNIVLLAILTAFTQAYAQDRDGMKRVEAARIGIITERLKLTPEQAEKFWPIYREFSENRRMIREEMRDFRRGFDPATATEEQNKEMVELSFKLKERELALEREYSGKLLKVIDTRQLVSLRQAEEDFRRMVLQQLERRARQQEMREEMRDRNQERLNQKRGN